MQSLIDSLNKCKKKMDIIMEKMLYDKKVKPEKMAIVCEQYLCLGKIIYKMVDIKKVVDKKKKKN